jgi:uncharacterized protein YcaQ
VLRRGGGAACYAGAMASPRSETTPLLTNADARRLFLAAQGLFADPDRHCDTGTVLRLVDTLGFVQIDSIRVVERAHHLILAARLHGYRPQHLRRLLEHDRRLFEHWTHDAAAIPTRFFPHWQHRFAAHRAKIERNAWWRARLGSDAAAACAAVRQRIRAEGPLQSRDFESPPRGRDGAWWGWKPQKAALEYLWHTGELAITRRENFQKVYDLTERVLPAAVALPAPSPSAHLEWACSTALERLGVATASELAAFWQAVDLAAVRAWCRAREREGRIVAVRVASADGSRPVAAWTWPDWRARLRRGRACPADLRLLAPFDPILRDRRRTQRLFGFDYRFEGFVPAPRRRFGYYVLPILEGDRLVGRLDPRSPGTDGTVRPRRVWWESGIRPTRARERALETALERLSACREAGS